jgi:hypothetical protein
MSNAPALTFTVTTNSMIRTCSLRQTGAIWHAVHHKLIGRHDTVPCRQTRPATQEAPRAAALAPAVEQPLPPQPVPAPLRLPITHRLPAPRPQAPRAATQRPNLAWPATTGPRLAWSRAAASAGVSRRARDASSRQRAYSNFQAHDGWYTSAADSGCWRKSAIGNLRILGCHIRVVGACKHACSYPLWGGEKTLRLSGFW